MRLGIVVVFSKIETMEEKIKRVKDMGFDNCQIQSWWPELWTKQNQEEIKRLVNKYGVEINSFWCGWEGVAYWNFYEGQKTLGLVPEEYRERRVKNLCDGADFAEGLGVEDIVTHMGFIPENPYDPQYEPFCDAVRIVAKHLKKNGQKLLFESGQETPVTMLRCFETVGMDNLAVNLDTANLILYGKANPVDALEVFGKHVRNLHAKDGRYPINGHDLGVETRIGEGKVDFRGVITKLHELGYDRYITIEREIQGEQQIADIHHAKSYLTDLINEIYGVGQ